MRQGKRLLRCVVLPLYVTNDLKLSYRKFCCQQRMNCYDWTTHSRDTSRTITPPVLFATHCPSEFLLGLLCLKRLPSSLIGFIVVSIGLVHNVCTKITNPNVLLPCFLSLLYLPLTILIPSSFHSALQRRWTRICKAYSNPSLNDILWIRT